MAKVCDHEIVRALVIQLKVVLRKFEIKDFVWSRAFEYSVMTYIIVIPYYPIHLGPSVK